MLPVTLTWSIAPDVLYEDRFVNGALVVLVGEGDEEVEDATGRLLDLMVEDARPVAFLCAGPVESRIELALALLRRTERLQMKVDRESYVVGVGIEVAEVPTRETLGALGARAFLHLDVQSLSASVVAFARKLEGAPVGLIVRAASASPEQLVVYRRKLERASPSRGRAVVVGR